MHLYNTTNEHEHEHEQSSTFYLNLQTGDVIFPNQIGNFNHQVGNYGVPPETKDEEGLMKFMESETIHAAGLIVTDYSFEYSHWNAVKSLSQWLVEKKIPAMYRVDTRALTKKIRERGSILGRIEINNPIGDITFIDPNALNLVKEVTTKDIKVYGKHHETKIIAFDCGMKQNIIRCLVYGHKVCLTVVPYDYDLENNPANIEYAGIFCSNGPGDPVVCSQTIKSLKWAITLDPPKPIFGICLGNQLLALATGATTYKMKYGNRGMNQPCVDLRTTKCYVTSQNHGYAVDRY